MATVRWLLLCMLPAWSPGTSPCLTSLLAGRSWTPSGASSLLVSSAPCLLPAALLAVLDLLLYPHSLLLVD